MPYLSKRRVFGVLVLVGFLVLSWNSIQGLRAASSEYNFFNTSPTGDEGGLAVPASCDSRTMHSRECWWVPDASENGGHFECSNDDGDPAGWNGVDTPCTNNCGASGTRDCTGACMRGGVAIADEIIGVPCGC